MILRKYPSEVSSMPLRMCNCPTGAECPLNKFCLDKDVLYTGELTSTLNNYGTKIYKGICSTTFKERLGNHRKAFNHEKYKADSELSKEIWHIKQKGGAYQVKCTKDRNHTSYKPETKRCSLCDHEKLAIALHKDENLLNQRNEIISRCRHRFKYKLAKLVIWRQIDLTSSDDNAVSETSKLYLSNVISTVNSVRWRLSVNKHRGAWNSEFETKLCSIDYYILALL